MNKLDKDYLALCQDILDNGTKKQTRNGEVLSVFGRQIRHDMKDGFPLLTTKKMYFKGIVTELLWFLRGNTNIKFLVDNNCHIWDGDCYQAYLKNREKIQKEYKEKWGDEISNNPLSQEEFINKIKTDDEFAKKWGDLGPIYGKQWRAWKQFIPYDVTEENCKVAVKVTDQIADAIHKLKTNPDDRGIIVSAWNVGELDQMVLRPCHNFLQFYTRELSLEERINIALGWGYDSFDLDIAMGNSEDALSDYNIPTRAISLMWNQRSVDTPLGLPFNIASYGLLLEIIAKMVNMVPDQLIGNLGDCHIYSNQIDGCKEQIGRDLTLDERIDLASSLKSFDPGDFGIGINISEEHCHKVCDEYQVPRRTREPLKLPKLKISDRIVNDISEYTLDDIILENYQSHPKINFPLSN